MPIIPNQLVDESGYRRIVQLTFGIGFCFFFLGLLIGFLLGGDSEKLKPVAEWDGPVGLEMRRERMMKQTDDLIEALKKCIPGD